MYTNSHISYLIERACEQAGITYNSPFLKNGEAYKDAERLGILYMKLKRIAGELQDISEKHNLDGLGEMIKKEIQFIEEADHGIIKIAQMVELFDGIMVLKNPTKNQLQLKVISSKLNNTNASLTNAQGKVVKRFILKQGNQAIDISGIASGVYYLQSNEGSKKVIIE